MNKSFLLITILLFSFNILAQSASYPEVERKNVKDIYIKSVNTTSNYTQINFIYRNSGANAHYVFLSLPGHKDALYIKSQGAKYRLLSTQNIGDKDGITVAEPEENLEFSARFERLPSNTTKFDLIEGQAGTWNFYGVNLNNSSSKSSTAEKFRVDYNHISIFDPKTETWGDWERGENTFVVNINEKGDIAHLRADGQTVIYKKLSGVEEGYTSEGNHHYQIIKALDEDGDVFKFQLFDDTSIGLKMMWGSFIVQFAYF